MKKKAQVISFITFILIAIIISILASVFIPTGTQLTTDAYTFADTMFLQSNETIQTIADTTMKNPMTTSTNKAIAATSTNRSIVNVSYTYIWIIILFLAGFIIFQSTQAKFNIQQGRIV